ncbi:glycoside hydrolase [Acidianus sp. RZ1]|uniref:glycoside hydrolase n=1 Tax=Acidianus sp. RZ1 TaxID=1540082 RepID=UPI001490CC41|nr:glycoside hydrolase [Acidianus sp. RZ1]NON62878.1 glycoside hydrolase [Acidianus sp. RZ1]
MNTNGPGKLSLFPSYLLLSNWLNDSILVVTGIPEPNPSLNGFPIYPASIRNIYVDGKLLNGSLNLYLNSNNASLNLENNVLLSGEDGRATIIFPPYSPYLLTIFNLSNSLHPKLKIYGFYPIEKNNIIELKGLINIYIYTNFSTTFSYSSNETSVIFSGRGDRFIEIGFNSFNTSIPLLIREDELLTSKWLNSSIFPNNLPKSLLKEYYLSLLVIKDDQNPVLGDFAAAPTPIYLHSWVRDSSFAAIALQDAGHYMSALKYWHWMSSAPQITNGVWYTRYNFYTGKPSYNFGIEELDSLGLFEIGISNFLNLTENYSFFKEVLPRLNDTLRFQISHILNSSLHLIPQDLSVWEDREAYHFWTEAFNAIGMIEIRKTLEEFNITYPDLKEAEMDLNESIISHFWTGKEFVSAMTSSVLFTSNGTKIVLSPDPPVTDSATILPLVMGFLPYNSKYTKEDVQNVSSMLTIQGGLARFPGDDYHYSEYLYDSTGPDPPWIITTLFKALYYSREGNYVRSVNLLYWTYNHSQQGLLPEAIDPKLGVPLPTTSPLTWSAAMFVIVSLSLPEPQNSSYVFIIELIIGIVVIVTLFFALRKIRKR